MRYTVYLILVCAAGVALMIAGCTYQQPAQSTAQPTTSAMPTQTPAPADTVKVMDSTLGKILTDANGMTLYYFINDIPASGASTCYSAANCSTIWPVFSVDTIAVSPPLDAADFSSITRTDGTKQTAFYGWPLYYFSRDTKPGDINGENVVKKWYVAKPDYTVMIASTPALGAFLTDPSGKTLYYFIQDASGKSACTGACLAKWPAFYSSTVVAPSILMSSDFGTVTRSDGTMQSSYMGRPLYYFAGDTSPGATSGEGFNNAWHVANTTGFIPTPTTQPTPVPTTNPPVGPNGGSMGGY